MTSGLFHSVAARKTKSKPVCHINQDRIRNLELSQMGGSQLDAAIYVTRQ